MRPGDPLERGLGKLLTDLLGVLECFSRASELASLGEDLPFDAVSPETKSRIARSGCTRGELPSDVGPEGERLSGPAREERELQDLRKRARVLTASERYRLSSELQAPGELRVPVPRQLDRLQSKQACAPRRVRGVVESDRPFDRRQTLRSTAPITLAIPRLFASAPRAASSASFRAQAIRDASSSVSR